MLCVLREKTRYRLDTESWSYALMREAGGEDDQNAISEYVPIAEKIGAGAIPLIPAPMA